MNGTLNPGAQILIALIPIVGIVFAFLLIFFAILWRHNEVKMRIRNGSYVPIKFNFKEFALLVSLCCIGAGAVITLMFAIMEKKSWALLGGLLPLSFGIMLLIFYKVNPEYKKLKSDEDEKNS